MKQLLRTIWRWFVSWNAGVIVAVIVFIAADFRFWPSILSGMGRCGGVRHHEKAASSPAS
ncbi:5-bromo-4-chloroindolyl phosphate hydrolysis protein [Geobacillus sp. BCO2]|nr:5-bromo-4-chloroindolyl phosphate hydrolysis protein [Geobacillus sp. BCO2]